MAKRIRDMSTDEIRDLVLDELVGVLMGDDTGLGGLPSFDSLMKALRRRTGFHGRWCVCADCCALWDALGWRGQEPEEPF